MNKYTLYKSFTDCRFHLIVGGWYRPNDSIVLRHGTFTDEQMEHIHCVKWLSVMFDGSFNNYHISPRPDRRYKNLGYIYTNDILYIMR